MTATVAAPSEAAPVAASDGINLVDVMAVTAIVHAPGGQTFTGAGDLLAYYKSHLPGSVWTRFTKADINMADAAGLADATIDTVPPVAPVGQFVWVPLGVGLSGGVQFTLDYSCVLRGPRLEAPAG